MRWKLFFFKNLLSLSGKNNKINKCGHEIAAHMMASLFLDRSAKI